MAEYMLSVHHDYDDRVPAHGGVQPLFEAVDPFDQKVRDEGAWVFAGGLMPTAQTTTVDNTGDTPIVTDGPFAESKEYLGGFWVIEPPTSTRPWPGRRGLGGLPRQGRGAAVPGRMTGRG